MRSDFEIQTEKWQIASHEEANKKEEPAPIEHSEATPPVSTVFHIMGESTPKVSDPAKRRREENFDSPASSKSGTGKPRKKV